MKNTVLVIIAFFFIAYCKSQPNPGFEDWAVRFGIQEPTGWQTPNFLSLLSPPNPLSAFKASGIEAHSGSSALKLKTVFLNNKPSQIAVNDSVGGAYTGQLTLAPLSDIQGFPYTARPQKLQFWAWYIPVGNDIAKAGVLLKKSKNNGYDTIAYSVIDIVPTSTYNLFEINIDYTSADLPDSAIIAFATSKNSVTARVGSTLYIDDLAFSGYVGEKEIKVVNKVILFPNPTTDYLFISTCSDHAKTIKLTDLSGKAVETYKIEQQNITIDTRCLPSGIYYYEVNDNTGIVLNKGKINIIN
jgi:hypothetical protein